MQPSASDNQGVASEFADIDDDDGSAAGGFLQESVARRAEKSPEFRVLPDFLQELSASVCEAYPSLGGSFDWFGHLSQGREAGWGSAGFQLVMYRRKLVCEVGEPRMKRLVTCARVKRLCEEDTAALLQEFDCALEFSHFDGNCGCIGSETAVVRKHLFLIGTAQSAPGDLIEQSHRHRQASQRCPVITQLPCRIAPHRSGVRPDLRSEE